MLLAITLPLIGALSIALLGKYELQRNIISTTISLTLLMVLVLYTVGYFDLSNKIELPITIPHLGLLFTCSVEGLAFSFMISFLWILANIYAIGYMKYACDVHQKRFFFFFTLSISFAIGIAFSGDLLTMFVFYELLTISTYPLIINRISPDTLKAGKTYLRFLMGSSLFLLFPAIVSTYHFLGSGDFGGVTKLPDVTSHFICSILLMMFVYGAAKSALMPMHRWLVAAMVAQTPVSALLHAVAVVKAGIFFIIKANFYIFGIDWIKGEHWLVFVASFTLIMASICALRATHLKTRLAYSTISQLAYILLFAIISDDIMLPVLYMVLHAFAKITLFFAAGAISTGAQTQELSELKGIGRCMPWTMCCFSISALSMIGLPLTGMFVGKVLLLSSAVSSAMHLFIVAVVISSTLLNTLYFLPIIYNAFFSNTFCKCNDVRLSMRLPMMLTTVCNVLAFWIFVCLVY